MADSDIVLFVAPGSCTRVPTIALEEIGIAFETRPVRFALQEHKSVDYRRVNAKGKVPALLFHGVPLTENVAILQFLADTYPDARLLPPTSDAMARALQTADLCFCSATLHPIVTRIRMPVLFAGPDAVPAVRAMGDKAMIEYFNLIEARLDAGPWWYGERWSIVDAYLNWVFWRVEGAGFDVSYYPRLSAHARANGERPSVIRALAREQATQQLLKDEGHAMTLPPEPVRTRVS